MLTSTPKCANATPADSTIARPRLVEVPNLDSIGLDSGHNLGSERLPSASALASRGIRFRNSKLSRVLSGRSVSEAIWNDLDAGLVDRCHSKPTPWDALSVELLFASRACEHSGVSPVRGQVAFGYGA